MIQRIVTVLQDAFNRVPTSSEPQAANPAIRAQAIGKSASMKAAAISSALALPPGPAGLLTVIPDLMLIWKLQGQMVADVAAAYGKTVVLTREGMFYCLFKHAGAQMVRNMVVSEGGRLLIRRATPEILTKALERVGLSLSQRITGQAASRWLPVAGAMGVGAFAYYDTHRISKTARETFSADVAVDN
jgi:hypothetical protein